MRTEKQIMKKTKKLLYIMGCGLAVMLLAAGCVPQQNEPQQPEQSVQVSTVGNAVNEDVTPNNAVSEEQDNTDETDTTDTTTQQQVPLPNDDPYNIDPSKPMIALTFDDGPSKYTWDIVNTLKAHNARATFFLVGSSIATHEAAIDYTLENHNEIASHSFSHKDMTKLSDTEMLNQIRTVDAALLEQHEYTPALFRVPYGSRDERVLEVLKAEGKPAIGWNVDPHDWEVRDKDYVKKVVLDNVKDGDIILMHDIYQSTAQAVAELVPTLQEQGYQIVTVSEMFQQRGITPQPGEYYRELPPMGDAKQNYVH